MKKRKLLITTLLLITLMATLVFAISEKQMCKRAASQERRAEYKTCINDYKECRKNCGQEKKSCLTEVKQDYAKCREQCIDRECKRTCSQKMRAEKKECSKRECLRECRDEKNECKKQAKNKYQEAKEACETTVFEVSQEECEAAGGLYHEICNGPYFDIICSPQKFCICNGNNEYSCPSNYTCNHKIKNILPRKGNTIQGYKDFLGNELGDIGICEKQK